MEDTTQQVLFQVYVTQTRDLFGVVLFLDDGSESDTVPCYRSVFKSRAGGEVTVDGVTEIYAKCHQDAMDVIGLGERVTMEEFEAKMHKSVELAAEMMSEYALTVLDLGSVDGDDLAELFAEEWPDEAEEVVETTLASKRSLN